MGWQAAGHAGMYVCRGAEDETMLAGMRAVKEG